MGKYVKIPRTAMSKASPDPPRPAPFVAAPATGGLRSMDARARVEQADRFGHHLRHLEAAGPGVLQAKWDPVGGKDYEMWDEVIAGRRWYRKQTPAGYQYASEPADKDSPIKVFLLPHNIFGGVPPVLLPPPPQPSSSLLMPPPSFPAPSSRNSNRNADSPFKMPSLPGRTSNLNLNLPPRQVSSTPSPGVTPRVSSQQTVLTAGPDSMVTLARGCNSQEQFDNILRNRTAGGASPASNPSVPTEQQAISGVAFEGAPWQVSGARQQARRRVDYTEYSTSQTVIQSFGSRGGVVVIRVARRWIIQGSGSENGWFINDDTPVEVVWSRGNSTEKAEREKGTNVRVSTTQSEAEEFRKNNSNDDNGGNDGGFVS